MHTILRKRMHASEDRTASHTVATSLANDVGPSKEKGLTIYAVPAR
jgi:hypothetical protein